ncbi:hypothetical protein AAEX28_12160 [Lentisphaerota bacterium WC36G]|nr:hypothetical protein LJT99_14990 [Lentisphaerae bacterium WC36]
MTKWANSQLSHLALDKHIFISTDSYKDIEKWIKVSANNNANNLVNIWLQFNLEPIVFYDLKKELLLGIMLETEDDYFESFRVDLSI